MALDIPVRANLQFFRCLNDSISTWASHLPILCLASFLAILLSAISGTLLLGSLYAGFAIMILRAQQGEQPSMRDLFGQIIRFVRFFSMNIFIFLFFIFGLVIIAVLVFMSSDFFVFLLNAFKQVVAQETPWIIPIGSEHIGKFLEEKNIFWAVVLAACLLCLPGLVFVVKCFYIYLLAADRGVHIDEAYVESRKAVERYGFFRHCALILTALGILVGSVALSKNIADNALAQLCIFTLFQPLALGIFASAYNQTLCEEARQWESYKQQFSEMRDELQTAHDMQMGLLPQSSPDLPGYALDGTCIPANSVGGDYYAYRWLDEDKTKLGIVVADVSGKAMEAAVTAVRFNEMLRYECQNRIAPADILDGLNDSLEGQIDHATFITCCIAVLDVPTGKVTLASAGHCPPIHLSNRSQFIDLVGYPLGIPALVRPPTPYRVVHLTLAPGDRLVLYSDGVVEAQNARRNFFDDDRFVRCLEQASIDQTPTDLIADLVTDVKSFIGNARRTDDITLVILQRDLSLNP